MNRDADYYAKEYLKALVKGDKTSMKIIHRTCITKKIELWDVLAVLVSFDMYLFIQEYEMDIK
jgi:hypothetical protein